MEKDPFLLVILVILVILVALVVLVALVALVDGPARRWPGPSMARPVGGPARRWVAVRAVLRRAVACA